jgi:hypothetical protein
MKMIKTVLLVMALMLGSVSAYAYTANIKVEWLPYAAPSFPALSGFKLYKEGVYVCQTLVPTAVTMDCTVEITKPSTNFTLTAAFADNTESLHSAAYAFVYTPVLPAPSSLKITQK